MTISTTESEISYATDGSTRSFPIPFVFDDVDDLKVLLTDEDGNVTEVTSGFSTTGGNGSTGTLVFSSAPADNQTLTIIDDPALEQTIDYVSNDAFPAETNERGLDYLTRLIKRLSKRVDRTLRTRDGDPISDLTLGSVDNRKGKYLFFNAVTGAIEYAAAVIGETLSQSIIGQFLNPQTAAEISAGVTPTDYSYPPGVVLRYGTNATPGTTDMTTVIQTALNSGHKKIYAPAGTYLISAPLDIPNGVELYGDGHDTVFIMSGSATPNIIRLTNRTHVTIRNIRFTPPDTGTLRSAFYLAECTGVKVIDCWVTGQTNSSGVYMFDCDDCIVDRLYFDGGANLSGYAVFMGGCKGCRVTNSVAYRPNFGFAVVGADSLTFEGIYTSTRTNQEAFGNIISGCHVTSMGGHAFDVNSATGTVISACTAEDYAGVSGHAAFQIKHNSGDDARQNVCSGCTARNVPLGFFMQQGSNGVFTGCTAIGVDWGFALNSSNNSQFHACAVYDFKEYGIWINSGSIRNIINGVYMETATGTAVGIAIGPDAPGCNGNTFDNIRMQGTMAYAIDITTGNANNRFGHNVYVADQAIRDIDYASIWPVVVATPTISVDSTGDTIGARFNRGMVIAAARVVVTTAIVGSPQAQAGRVGHSEAIAAAQAITGDRGEIVNLTQASQLLAAGDIMLGRIGTAGDSGTVFFQYEGLPRL